MTGQVLAVDGGFLRRPNRGRGGTAAAGTPDRGCAVTTMRYALTSPGDARVAEQVFPASGGLADLGRTRSAYLPGVRTAHPKARRRPGRARCPERRPGRDARLEPSPAPGSVFRDSRSGAVLQYTLNLRLPSDHLAHTLPITPGTAWCSWTRISCRLELRSPPNSATAGSAIACTTGPPRRRRCPGPRREALLAQAEPVREWAALDEWDPAGMCFSSATTGLPKGVTYTHRALWLHSMAFCLADTLAVSERDRILPIVPMFHVNAWGIPFAATWMGATLVLPGPRPDARMYCELLQTIARCRRAHCVDGGGKHPVRRRA